MRHALLYIFFSTCLCQLAIGRGDVVSEHFLMDRMKSDTCSVPTFSIEKSGDVLRLAGVVPAENAFTFQWYKNGDKMADADTKNLQTKEAGYYTLKLTSKAHSSCARTSDNFIAIYPPDTGSPLWLAIDHTSNQLSAKPTIPGSTMEWYRNNQLIQGQSGTSIAYQADGTYQVKERYQGIVKESNEVVFNAGVAIEIIKSTYFQLGDPCRPGPYLKTDFISDIPVDYQWYFNGVPVKDSTKTHFNPVTTGEYQVSINIPFRNRTYVSGKYKLVPADFPKSLPIAKIDDACSGGALLKVDDAFMQKYQFKSIVWRKDGQELPDEPYPYYKAKQSGYYTFSMKYLVDGKAEECTYNSFIDFIRKTDADLNVGYAYAGSGCVVDSFKVFVEYNKNYTYNWMRNDTLLKNEVSHELFVKDKGMYKALVNTGDGCIKETNPVMLYGCTPYDSDRFLLLNPPVISADKTTVLVNEKSFIRANGCSNVNFQWIRDPDPIVGANQSSFEIKQSGTYRLEIEKLGCVAVSEPITIVVENILSAEPETEAAIKVFPNPFDETISIELPIGVHTGTEVKLTDTAGKLVKRWRVDTKHDLDLRDVADGVYLLSFEVGGKRVVRKVVKGR